MAGRKEEGRCKSEAFESKFELLFYYRGGPSCLSECPCRLRLRRLLLLLSSPKVLLSGSLGESKLFFHSPPSRHFVCLQRRGGGGVFSVRNFIFVS